MGTAGSILERSVIQGIVRQLLEEAKAAQANGGKTVALGEDASAKVYRTGDLVEYFSATHKAWIPARVTCTDGSGRIMVDVKPDTWIATEQQAWQIRTRAAPKAEAPKPADVPKAPAAAIRACSTQALERMLDQVEGDEGSPGSLLVVGEDELQEFEGSAESPSPINRAYSRAVASGAVKVSAAPQIGVAGVRAPFDDECSKLYAELGLGEGSMSDARASPVRERADKKLTVHEPPGIANEDDVEKWDLGFSLSAAELELLNGSV